MPNQYEYRAAARLFREHAEAFKNLTEDAQNLLPATELEGPFRDFFESSLGAARSVGQWTQGGLDGAAAECERRADVCEQYTRAMRAHTAGTDVVDEPPQPAPWAEVG